MTERKLYRCDICGVEYGKKEDALKCEKFHVKPVNIVDTRYNGMNVSQHPYPLKITVEMEDGKRLEYKR